MVSVSKFLILMGAIVLLGGCFARAIEADLAITNATVITAPNTQPITNATILIADGKVISIKSDGTPQRFNATQAINAQGRVVTAGLWNSHVHFTQPTVIATPAKILRDMALRRGFTTVVDLGSFAPQTLGLREQIQTGDIVGPRILMANGSFVTKNGTPSYLPPQIRLPEIATHGEAAPAVNMVIDGGAEHIKIFAGSFITPTHTLHIPPEIIVAIADAAHARGAKVFSHPTSMQGVKNSVVGGADILAHTAPGGGPWDDALIDEMVAQNLAIVPTLMLWRAEVLRNGGSDERAGALQNVGIAQLEAFHAAGGTVLFGTDTGYMPNYDPSEEYRAMALAGMGFDAILESLTTAPATLLSDDSGAIEIGQQADLVVFAQDPRENVAHFAQPFATIINGVVVYEAE